jgi:glycosyltransferase involved in cell wall biosynthesis
MLKRALDSVLAQTYDNIEIYIVDNGSSDDTEVVVAEYMTKHEN